MNGILCTYCLNASSGNLFENKFDKYLRSVGYTLIRTLDKSMSSLSTCHMSICLGWQSCYILLNLLCLDFSIAS